jgi:hypothetical protein
MTTEMPRVRRQATLYLPEVTGTTIESIRSQYNPVQFELIRAHVTLCREDEVPDWGRLASRLSDLGAIDVALEFGKPIREGNLVYLPARGSTETFDTLRNALLSTDGQLARKHKPHITLIHPRNGCCTDLMFDDISLRCEPSSVVFRSVTLIEQVDGGHWFKLKTFG